MKRKKILILAYLLISGIVFLLFYGFAGKLKTIKTVESRIKYLPEFSFNTLDGEKFRSCDIKKGPLVIIYFHPECEHCQYEISELVKHKDLIENCNFILVSNADPKSVENFCLELKLDNYPEIRLLLDKDYSFSEIFGAGYVPSTYLYDYELRLLKFYKGEVNPDILIKYFSSDKPE